MAFSLRKAEITFIDLWPPSEAGRRQDAAAACLTSLSPDDVDVGEAEAVQRFSVISVITLSGNWVPLKMFNLRVAARKRRGATGDGGRRRWGES